jgi:ribosome-binding ATPase YchF (GTP1/OBG family)
VVRDFPNELGEPPTPLQDARNFAEELVLADLQMIENKLERMQKTLRGVKAGSVTPETMENDLLLQIKAQLEEGKMVTSMQFTPDQEKMIRGFDFLTVKPMIVVANVPEDKASEGVGPDLAELQEYCNENDMSLMALCAKLEAEIAELPPDEEGEFMEAMGIEEPARNRLIRECYRKLGLISFFTAGEPEVKAYTINAGSTVIEAAGKIHSDIARGFIRAEVGHFDDVKAAGGWEEAKRENLVELHTREYIVQDGDVMYIRFKV